MNFSPTYRTRPCITYLCKYCKPKNGYPPVIIPKFIISGSKQIKRVFLQVVFSTDGCIEFYKNKYKKGNKEIIQRRISLSSYNPYLLKQFNEILTSLGFKTSITKNEIRIAGLKQILKFQKEIGFLDGVKISSKSRKWKDYDKNKLLNIVIDSY